MSLDISVERKAEIERIVLLLNIGLLEVLKGNLISINEAENCFFNLLTIDKLEKLGVNQKIIELIQLGCELEDIESLVPHKLSDSIQFLRETSLDLIKQMPQPKLPVKRWID